MSGFQNLTRQDKASPATQKGADGNSAAPPAFQLKADPLQKKEKEEDSIQKKSGETTGVGTQQASGGDLPAPVQSKMENSFGTDFSNVNIHPNSQSAKDNGALAYTQGNDVHFAPGQFKPDTNSGQELIGHELTHVVQQRQGQVQPTTQSKAGMPVNDDKSLEKEADDKGKAAAAGKSVGSFGAAGAAGNGASQQKSNPIQKYDGTGTLGDLSARYESNGNPGTVSTGRGDLGGVSYGSYQFASNVGTPTRFLQHSSGAPYAREFAGMTPGSASFSAKWREIAAREPDQFQEAQHAFVQSEYYDVIAVNTQEDLNFDINSRSQVLQDVFWSTAVQHGEETNVIRRAVGDQDPNAMTDEELIVAIYAERGRKNANGVLVRFSGSSRDVQAGVAARFISEMNDALNALFDDSARRLDGRVVGAGRANNPDDLAFVQGALVQLGYLTEAQVQADSRSGNSIPNTSAAISRFQSDRSSILGSADGVVGRSSERELLKAIGQGASVERPPAATGGETETTDQTGGSSTETATSENSNSETTVPENTGSGSSSIQSSVGEGGTNRTQDVATIQRLLNQNGAGLEVDGDIGPLTIGAISTFQQNAFGWSDGRVDPAGKTMEALQKGGSTPANLTGSVGSGGQNAENDVRVVQRLLNTKGFSLKVDGLIGNNTISAIESFQQEHLGFRDGRVDVDGKTWAALSGGSAGTTSETETTTTTETSSSETSGSSGGQSAGQTPGSGTTTGGETTSPTGGETTSETSTQESSSNVRNVDIGQSVGHNGGKNISEDVRKVQQALSDIGIYVGTVDGANGDKTMGAIYQFQVAFGLTEDGRVDPGGATNQRLNRTPTGAMSVTRDEFYEDPDRPVFRNSKYTNREKLLIDGSGRVLPPQFWPKMKLLIQNLEVLSGYVSGLNINSGYRSPFHNDNEGGVVNSNHQMGEAVDLGATGIGVSELNDLIRRLINEGKMTAGGVGYYPNSNFVHYDVRGYFADWTIY